MMSGKDIDPRLEDGVRHYEIFNGKKPPIGPDGRTVEFGTSSHTREWRDYEDVKSVNAEEVTYSDLAADSAHQYDPENDWAQYDPSEEFATNEQIGEAIEAFEAIMENVEVEEDDNPQYVNSNIQGRYPSEMDEDIVTDGGYDMAVPAGGMPSYSENTGEENYIEELSM